MDRDENYYLSASRAMPVVPVKRSSKRDARKIVEVATRPNERMKMTDIAMLTFCRNGFEWRIYFLIVSAFAVYNLVDGVLDMRDAHAVVLQ